MKILGKIAVEVLVTCAALVAVEAIEVLIDKVKRDQEFERKIKEEDERLKEELGDLVIVPKGGN